MRLGAIIAGLLLVLAAFASGSATVLMSAPHVHTAHPKVLDIAPDGPQSDTVRHDHLKHCKSGHAVGCGFAGPAVMPAERGVAPDPGQASPLNSEQDFRKPAWALLPERPPKRA